MQSQAEKGNVHVKLNRSARKTWLECHGLWYNHSSAVCCLLRMNMFASAYCSNVSTDIIHWALSEVLVVLLLAFSRSKMAGPPTSRSSLAAASS